jgi:hypothetical protein
MLFATPQLQINAEIQMKRSVVVMLSAILLSVALSQAQDKATLSTYRILPKSGKDAALKKAIAAHAAKYHTGNWKWRVFMVLSGPDEGAYMINEGPNSWTDLENRKDISDEHTRDYETNVLPLVERTVPESYFIYQKELSSDAVGGPMKKALLRSFYTKPGKAARFKEYLKTWKQVWEKMGRKVTVWSSFYSGEPRIVVAGRLTDGWINLEESRSKEAIAAFDELAGTGAYVRFLEDMDRYVARIDEEMIELLPDVSSK